MSVNFNRSGTINSPVFYESGAMNTVTNFTNNTSYVPSTGTNSTLTAYQWLYPSGTIAGETFRVKLTVEYFGFDTSNQNGTFSIYFDGANGFKNQNAWGYYGTNPVTTALNNCYSLKNIVLSDNGAQGVATYETNFIISQEYLNSYIGSRIGVHSDYSNGVGRITLSNCEVISEKYIMSGGNAMKIGEEYITVGEFNEI